VAEDLIQAAKAAAELEPAVEALAEATGALEPVRETTGWLADMIHYRRMGHQAKLLMKAADKIRATGLPPSAVSDKLLRAVLEDGPLEDDHDMQDRWANLLANAFTKDDGSVRIAFPKILSELEPGEAMLLDQFASRTSSKSFLQKKHSVEEPGEGGHRSAIDNLVRLGLLNFTRTLPTTLGSISDDNAKITGVQFTRLGWDFVQACREPRPIK
jgi:hypothetical protein